MGRIKDIFKNKDITEKLIAMGFDYAEARKARSDI